MYFESVEKLELCLVELLSEETDLKMEEIDPKASFAALGLDSIESVALACRLDEMFDDFTVKPELFWEVDCVSQLAVELFARARAVEA